MHEKRSIAIRNKIFEKKDIKKMEKFFINEWEKDHDNNRNDPDPFYFNFAIRCQDETSYSSQSLEIFDDDSIIDMKQVDKITMHFRGNSTVNDMALGLNSYCTCNTCNQFEISGKDGNWVKAKFSEFQEIINSIKPQESFYQKCYSIINIILSISLFFFVYQTFSYFMAVLTLDDQSSNSFPEYLNCVIVQREKFMDTKVSIFLAVTIAATFSIIGTKSVEESTKKLYPSIEFDFGPDHMNIVKQRKKQISLILSLIIVPFLISLLSGMLLK
jgi:hypothetical protein